MVIGGGITPHEAGVREQVDGEFVQSKEELLAVGKRTGQGPVGRLDQALLQCIDAAEAGHRAQRTQHRSGTHWVTSDANLMQIPKKTF